MKRFLIDLSRLPNKDTLYKQIDSLAWDTYPTAGKPGQYEVMWDHPEALSSLVPELPEECISESD